MRGEPQAVTEQEQRAITDAAHLAWSRTMRRRWGEAAAQINAVLDAFSEPQAVHGDRRVMSGVRAVRRSTEALGRRIGA
jgi:hypothetical protein